MVVALAWTAALATFPAAAAQEVTQGSVVTIDRLEVAVGERLLVTIDGFERSPATISFCGNGGARGSADCNMIGSEGVRVRPGEGPQQFYVPVSSPPKPCPCVVRVSTSAQDEVAVASVAIAGHPVAPVDGTAKQLAPVEVQITAEPAPRGLVARLRTATGGPTSYAVTITVRNRSPEPVASVRLAGVASRAGDDVAVIDLPATGPLQPAQTWRHEVLTTVPAPVLGQLTWSVTATGARDPVSAETTTQSRPLLLLALTSVLVVDLGLLIRRWSGRRGPTLRRRRTIRPVPVSG